MRSGFVGIFLSLATAVSMLGCAQVPVAELESYRTSFEQVESIGTQLYEEAAQVVSDAKNFKPDDGSQISGTGVNLPTSNPPATFEPESDTPEFLTDQRYPKVIALRIHAIETVTAYNDALVAHVSGDPIEKIVAPLRASQQTIASFAKNVPVKSGSTLTSAVTKIVTAVGTFSPIGAVAPGVIEGLKGLAKLGLQAKAASEVKQALLDGYPSIVAVLDVLKQDTGHLYGFQKIRCELTKIPALESSGKEVLTPLNAMTGPFARPEESLTIGANVKALEMRMTKAVSAIFQPGTNADPCGSGKPVLRNESRVIRVVGSYPYQFKFAKSNGKALTVGTMPAFERLVSDYEERASDIVKATDALRNYHAQVLPEYVVLLEDAKSSLDLLHKSVTRKQSIEENVTRLVTIAGRIEGNAKSIRAGLSK